MSREIRRCIKLPWIVVYHNARSRGGRRGRPPPERVEVAGARGLPVGMDFEWFVLEDDCEGRTGTLQRPSGALNRLENEVLQSSGWIEGCSRSPAQAGRLSTGQNSSAGGLPVGGDGCLRDGSAKCLRWSLCGGMARSVGIARTRSFGWSVELPQEGGSLETDRSAPLPQSRFLHCGSCCGDSGAEVRVSASEE